MIYFDSAATTFQKPPQVRRAMGKAMECCASPGRGGYVQARRADALVFSCREAAAKLFDCAPEQVVFTMNATHGLNIAIRSLVRPGSRVVISGFEHNAVVRPLHLLGADVVIAGGKLFDSDAVLEDFARTITPRTAAVICTHVSNVFGFILPVTEIAALCRERGVPFVLDASQSAGSIAISLQKSGADFVAMPGHKGLYGPQGTGILLCAQPGLPLLAGGTGTQSKLRDMPSELPERLEAGTQNVCGIAGLRAGIQYVLDSTEAEIMAHEQKLRRRLLARMQRMEGITVFVGPDGLQSGVLSFCVPGLDCVDAAELLGSQGIAVRAGLHCAPLAHESANTLQDGTVRISFSAFNTQKEVDLAADALSGLHHYAEM